MSDLSKKIKLLGKDFNFVKTARGFNVFKGSALVVERFSRGTCYYDGLSSEEFSKVVSIIQDYLNKNQEKTNFHLFTKR